jgi:hypothetical protein
MSEHANEVHKVMDIRFYLPADEAALNSWFTRCGFRTVTSGTGEQAVTWPTASQLFAWLRDTGAIAGTGKLFSDSKKMEAVLIDRMAKRFACDGGCRTTHKFVYGVYRNVR